MGISPLWGLEGVRRERREAGLDRKLRPRTPDDSVLDLASNDYLGLHRDPRVVAAGAQALHDYGLGSTGSRLVTGATDIHDHLEVALAEFLGFGSATVLSSGYMANLAAVTSLVGRGDHIISDAASHASLIDACRLSRAHVTVTPVGDLEAVKRALTTLPDASRTLIITDSVYSADGTVADISGLYHLAHQHGATLLVDEAHGLGVLGPGGKGAVAQAGLSGADDVVVTVTLSKSLGSQGGAVLGPPLLRQHVLNHARQAIFDTALAPVAAAGALQALRILEDEPELATKVTENSRLIAQLWGVPEVPSAVVPVILGDPTRAVAARDELLARGVLVGVFRPPSVPEGTSRLRITARANLTPEQIQRARPATA